MNTKYIFVTGGVASSLGKGILAASLGKLLQAHGYNVANKKLDPYLNIDPNTLNPYEHGECYVTADGHVADLDLGHYERFLNIETTRNSNGTTGRIYQSVISKERAGQYNGKTVQVIPHITNEIKSVIMAVPEQLETAPDFNVSPCSTLPVAASADCECKHSSALAPDFIIVEIGGTVGDIEGLPYIEAVRQMRWEHPGRTLCIHLTYVPYLAAAGELKTKPTQHSVKALQELGVQPDIVVLRTEHEIDEDMKRKVSLFCNVSNDAVIESNDCKSIYEVPLRMQSEGLDTVVLRKFGLEQEAAPADLHDWTSFLDKKQSATEELHIALIGKYVQLQDAYKSLTESLYIASAYNDKKLRLHTILSDDITPDNIEELLHVVNGKGERQMVTGVIVAPGLGTRGIEGNIAALQYTREHNIPTLAITMGMQNMAEEFATNVLHAKEPVILTEGDMRLGAYSCELKEGSKVQTIYGKTQIRERHRHNYEFDTKAIAAFEKAGMLCSGINPKYGLVEIIELPEHKWYIGVQFHPEYNSTVLRPHPLFMDFIKTAAE